MKILHTSDLHIGKRLEGHERIQEQREVLKEILNIAEKENVEIIICAGDVFDTYTPSADAESLFYEFAAEFCKNGRAFVAISGNHDDADRLSACSPIAEKSGIFILGDNKRIIKPQTERKGIKLLSSGESYLIFGNDKGEKVFINCLPYPTQYRYKETTEGSYPEQINGWINLGHLANKEKLPEILLAHIFTLGGIVSESEREIDLGGARAVPPQLLPDCDYIALGHLHKFQPVKKGIAYYCGAPMQYSFDEAGSEKFVITFDIDSNGINNFTKHTLSAAKKLARLSANGFEMCEKVLKGYENYLVELTVNLSEPMVSSMYRTITNNHPNVIKIIPNVENGEVLRKELKGLSPIELFKEFYKKNYNTEPPKELSDLFLDLMENDN